VSSRHTALVVEDDVGTSDGLVEILKGVDCDSVVTDNKSRALELLITTSPCIILLDLEIREQADAIKGHTAHGISLLKRIRELHPEHPGLSWWLPVVVISGFASEINEAVQVMRDGATTLVQKPFKIREVSNTLLEELRRSGRDMHASCLRGPVAARTADQELLIRFIGDHDGHRSKVMIGSTALELANSELKLLLQLALAHQKGEPVHKIALGAKKDESGYKSVSRLRNELKPALTGGPDIITNDHHGNYGLANNVVVAECHAVKLKKIGDATITELAAKVAANISAK
jgi:DNA-binding response OmpR family regulator